MTLLMAPLTSGIWTSKFHPHFLSDIIYLCLSFNAFKEIVNARWSILQRNKYEVDEIYIYIHITHSQSLFVSSMTSSISEKYFSTSSCTCIVFVLPKQCLSRNKWLTSKFLYLLLYSFYLVLFSFYF